MRQKFSKIKAMVMAVVIVAVKLISSSAPVYADTEIGTYGAGSLVKVGDTYKIV